MTTLADDKRAWLISALGTDANAARSKSNNDLEREFLNANSGLSPVVASVNDQWQAFLTAQSVAVGSISTRMRDWAAGLNSGSKGSLSDNLAHMFANVPWSAGSLPIPEENLLAYYDWNSVAATPVAWNDESGNGNNLTGVGVLYKLGDGILLYGSYFSLAGGLLGGLPAAHTVYAKVSVGGFLPAAIIEEVNVTKLELNASNQVRLSQSTNGTSYTNTSAGTTPTLPIDIWSVLNYVGGTGFNIYKDKTLVTPDTTGPAGNLGNNANDFTVGNASAWFTIKCLAIYNAAHDTTTRESIIDTINSVFP